MWLLEELFPGYAERYHEDYLNEQRDPALAEAHLSNPAAASGLQHSIVDVVHETMHNTIGSVNRSFIDAELDT